ncbi:MAG: LytR/AlgR family response regulator transcription factor [Enterococcus sp.]
MNNYSVRIFIIEDSLYQRKNVHKIINTILKEKYSLNAEFIDISNIHEFYKEIPNLTFYLTDLFIIDYDLHTYFNGIDIASAIQKKNPDALISFLTAFMEKAREVINSGITPVAYALKDPSKEKFNAELYNLTKLMINKLSLLQENSTTISIKLGNSTRFIPVEDICYVSTIKKERRKVYIRTQEEQLLVNSDWKNINSLLKDQSNFAFFKFYIFNLKNIVQFSRMENQVIFVNGESLFVGTKILDKLIKELVEFEGKKYGP